MLDWIISHHAVSIGFGVISVGFWLGSVFVKAKKNPNRVLLTMGDGEKPVDLHHLVLSLQLQTKYNGYAAACAAVAILGQIGGA